MESNCLFKILDFKAIFSKSLNLYEAHDPEYEIFDGIYPQISACNQTDIFKSDESYFGKTHFQDFYSFFSNADEALKYFNKPSPVNTITPQESPQQTDTASLVCYNFYNECLSNSNWTSLQQHPCNTSFEENFKNLDYVLTSSLESCPKPQPTQYSLHTGSTTKIHQTTFEVKTERTTATKKNVNLITQATENKVFSTWATTAESHREPNTTIINTGQVENLTQDQSSLAAIIIIPLVLIIAALGFLCWKKRKNDLFKQKRLNVHRTESTITANTTITTAPNTPIIEAILQEQIRKDSVKTGDLIRIDSTYSSRTPNSEALNPIDFGSLNRSLDLIQNNLKNTSKKSKKSSHYLSSSNIDTFDDMPTKNFSNFATLSKTENLASEWNERFNSIIDWMNHSDLDLNQSET